MLRCRSCGYVAAESATRDVCPACGVPRAMLEPWVDPLSEKRRRILDLGLHPILIHFTVSFAASAFALGLLAIAVPSLLGGLLSAVLLVMVTVLPIATAGSWAAGLVDGTARFRRSTTPVLKRKMIMGGSVFIETTAAAALVLAFGLTPLWVRIAATALLGLALGAVAMLAKIGAGLMEAKLPG